VTSAGDALPMASPTGRPLASTTAWTCLGFVERFWLATHAAAIFSS
jgi:hypothetical protein